MAILGRISRVASAAIISAMMLLPDQSAFASKEGRDTLLGAGLGAIAGGLLGHGRVGPIVGGAVAGAVLGDLAAPHRKYYGYYGGGRPYRYAYWRPRYYWAAYPTYAYWQPYRRHYWHAYWSPHRYYAYWPHRHWRYAWTWRRHRERVYIG